MSTALHVPSRVDAGLPLDRIYLAKTDEELAERIPPKTPFTMFFVGLDELKATADCLGRAMDTTDFWEAFGREWLHVPYAASDVAIQIFGR